MEQLLRREDTFDKEESVRVLKRTIDAITTPNKTRQNDRFKSPARKEMKLEYESKLIHELNEWKALCSANDEILQTTILNIPENAESILSEEQINFLKNATDEYKMINESNKFRDDLIYLKRLNGMLKEKREYDLTNEVHNRQLAFLDVYTDQIKMAKFISISDDTTNDTTCESTAPLE